MMVKGGHVSVRGERASKFTRGESDAPRTKRDGTEGILDASENTKSGLKRLLESLQLD